MLRIFRINAVTQILLLITDTSITLEAVVFIYKYSCYLAMLNRVLTVCVRIYIPFSLAALLDLLLSFFRIAYLVKNGGINM